MDLLNSSIDLVRKVDHGGSSIKLGFLIDLYIFTY